MKRKGGFSDSDSDLDSDSFDSDIFKELKPLDIESSSPTDSFDQDFFKELKLLDVESSSLAETIRHDEFNPVRDDIPQLAPSFKQNAVKVKIDFKHNMQKSRFLQLLEFVRDILKKDSDIADLVPEDSVNTLNGNTVVYTLPEKFSKKCQGDPTQTVNKLFLLFKEFRKRIEEYNVTHIFNAIRMLFGLRALTQPIIIHPTIDTSSIPEYEIDKFLTLNPGSQFRIRPYIFTLVEKNNKCQLRINFNSNSLRPLYLQKMINSKKKIFSNFLNKYHLRLFDGLYANHYTIPKKILDNCRINPYVAALNFWYFILQVTRPCGGKRAIEKLKGLAEKIQKMFPESPSESPSVPPLQTAATEEKPPQPSPLPALENIKPFATNSKTKKDLIPVYKADSFDFKPGAQCRITTIIFMLMHDDTDVQAHLKLEYTENSYSDNFYRRLKRRKEQFKTHVNDPSHFHSRVFLCLFDGLKANRYTLPNDILVTNKHKAALDFWHVILTHKEPNEWCKEFETLFPVIAPQNVCAKPSNSEAQPVQASPVSFVPPPAPAARQLTPCLNFHSAAILPPPLRGANINSVINEVFRFLASDQYPPAEKIIIWQSFLKWYASSILSSTTTPIPLSQNSFVSFNSRVQFAPINPNAVNNKADFQP